MFLKTFLPTAAIEEKKNEINIDIHD